MKLIEYFKEVVSRSFPNSQLVYEDSHGNLIIKYNDLKEVWGGEDFNVVGMHTSQAIDYMIDFFKESNEKYTPSHKYKVAYDKEDKAIFIFYKQHIDFLNRIEIIEDEAARNFYSCPKYPYYRLRGKPITPSQALDIIFGPSNSDGINFYNNWNSSQDGKMAYGWVHPDGTVGINNTTTKYPNWGEFIYDMLIYKAAYPYLDFVIGITDWDNYPEYVYEDDSRRERVDSDYPGFIENIVYGIWVHDNKIELMEPSRAQAKYSEYAEKYTISDTSRYIKKLYTTEEWVVYKDYMSKQLEEYKKQHSC